MRILREWRGLDPADRGIVAAIGNFDGVHRGHRAVIGAAREAARRLRAPLGVVTFEPHPRRFFQPDAPPFRLSSLADKATAMGELGVERLFALSFDRDFAALTADAFVERVLIDGLGVRHVAVGEDFVFGKARGGDVTLLQRLGRDRGFGVSAVAPQGAQGDVFSSTLVREYLTTGRPGAAADLLGRYWTIEGEVVAGDRRGRTIGFPTANLALGDHLQPATGVYAVRAGLVDAAGRTAWLPGVANFGRRPTFDKTDVLLEVHLLDFQGDLYGRTLKVAFVEYLRPERRFEGLDALKAQIVADAAKAREILSDPAYAAQRFAGQAS